MIRVVETDSELFKFLVVGKTIYLGKNDHLAEKTIIKEPPKIQMTSY